MKKFIAVGKEVYSLENLKDSAESAAFFLSGRLFYGNSRIYIADILPKAEQLQRDNKPIPKETIRRFESLVEAMDLRGMKLLIQELFQTYENGQKPNPMLCLYMVFELGEHLALVLSRLNIHPRETKKIVNKLEELSEDCDTIPMLRSTTEKYFEDIIKKYLAACRYMKKQEGNIDKNEIKQLPLHDFSIVKATTLVFLNTFAVLLVCSMCFICFGFLHNIF